MIQEDLRANLKVTLDQQSWRQIVSQIQSETYTSMAVGQSVTGNTVNQGGATGGGGIGKEVGDAVKQSTETTSKVGKETVAAQEKHVQKTEEGNEESKKAGAVLGGINAGISMGIGAVTGILSFGFGIIEKLWKMVVEFSPGLKAILDLFNVALQLFFLPIGTALMGELLPMVTDLLENAAEMSGTMWDAYENGGFGSMLSTAFAGAIPLLFDTIIDAISLIPEDSPLGGLRTLLITLVEFVRDHGKQLLMGLLDLTLIVMQVMTGIVTNFPLLFGLIGTMIGLQIAQLLVAVANGSIIFGINVGYVAAAAIAGTAIAGVGAGALIGSKLDQKTNGADNIPAAAEGATIFPTPGGSIYRGGEGGEIEYVVPRSKVGDFINSQTGSVGGGVIVNFNAPVYGMTDLDDHIVTVVDRYVNTRRSRSTF